jgi:uncharacterized SAM-binding protein YcdF (DUF218 family)
VSEVSDSKPARFGWPPVTHLRHCWRYFRQKPRRLLLCSAVATFLALYGVSIVSYAGTRPMVILWLACTASLAGLWLRRQEKRRRLWVLTIAFLGLTLYFLPPVSYLLCAALESPYPPLGRRPEDVDAIVVLAGGLRAPDVQGLPFQPSESTLYRCLRAAEMYHRGPQRRRRHCLVIVSGGQTDPKAADPSCARVMRDFLVGAGVAPEDIVEEGASTNTYENAVETAHLLRERGIRKVLLVTDGLHLARAVRCFHQQGVEVIPCGCSYRTRNVEWSIRSFIPNTYAAQGLRAALHEYVGLLAYYVQGRI